MSALALQVPAVFEEPCWSGGQRWEQKAAPGQSARVLSPPPTRLCKDAREQVFIKCSVLAVMAYNIQVMPNSSLVQQKECDAL